MNVQTPIAFCIYNRPEKTRRVFDAIASARPAILLVVADGPRSELENDVELVTKTRAVIETVDWDCDVRVNYADENLGCRFRMASGLDWAFEQEERVIVLEDDCLPHESFFGYCDELLDCYANHPEVMMVSGNNFQPSRRTLHSYYFSRWTHIWGWASWRRAWKHYDLHLSAVAFGKTTNSLRPLCVDGNEYAYWSQLFDRAHRGEIDTWDFAWTFACWARGGMTVVPEVNLVSNIGFDDSATHTTQRDSKLANLPAHSIGELFHPREITPHYEADLWTYENLFRPDVQQFVSQHAPQTRGLLGRLFSKRRRAA